MLKVIYDREIFNNYYEREYLKRILFNLGYEIDSEEIFKSQKLTKDRVFFTKKRVSFDGFSQKELSNSILMHSHPSLNQTLNQKRGFIYFFEDSNSLSNFISTLPAETPFLNSYPDILEVKLSEPIDGKYIQRDSLIEALIEYLSKNSLKITFAESCTGGALANRFISYSGASNIIDGSFITYSNEIKSSWLGVKKETLEQFGAVSRECVKEMAKGAREKLGSNIAIAVSGIAGPTGAVEDKPVGTVYICVDFDGKQKIERLNLDGDRVFIQAQSVNLAIKLLLNSLGDKFFDFFSKNP